MDLISLDDLDITELPMPPQGVLAVVHACARNEMDATRISELITQVPSLSAELLRISNTAYFGFSGEVTSIARAVTLIGHRVLRNVALCIALKATLKSDQLPAFPVAEFWEAALRRGVCARILAAETAHDKEAGFTVGLLQDFGLLVMFYLNPKVTNEWSRLSELTPDSRYDLEQQLFNTTHDRVGLQLAQAWLLPEEFTIAMGYHHRGTPAEIDKSSVELCKLAQCADWMSAVFTSDNRREAIKQSRSLLLDYYGISSEQSNDLMAQVAVSMNKAASAFRFDLGEQVDFEDLIGEANLHLVEENLSFQQMNWHLEHTLKERDKIASELNKELDLAREVQRSLLPGESDNLEGVAGLNVSAKVVSGDFYDFYKLRNGKVAFCIADVSGKGMNAALLMAKASSLFHCLGKSIHDPSKLLAMLNREILETSIHGMFVTMLAGVFDPESRVVKIANAGHLPAILMRGGTFDSEYPAMAPPLGVIPEAIFPLDELRLTSNMHLYLYTDGLLEAKVNGEQRLEREGLLQLFSLYSDIPPAMRLLHIVTDVRSRGGRVDDDMTILLLKG